MFTIVFINLILSYLLISTNSLSLTAKINLAKKLLVPNFKLSCFNMLHTFKTSLCIYFQESQVILQDTIRQGYSFIIIFIINLSFLMLSSSNNNQQGIKK